MSDSLNEKVNYILEDSDFNDLPFEERKRIGKYMAEQQILTLHQVINKDKAHTTEAWRKKTTSWLKNCVDTFYKEYRYPADLKTENSSEIPNNCETCKHNKLEWYSEICDSCCGNNNHYEPKDEPQTDGILFKGNLKEGDYKLIKTSNGWVLEGNDIAYYGEPQTERSE